MSIVFAAIKGSTVVNHHGVTIRLSEGDTWAADDPFVRARPDLFSPDPPLVRRTSPAGVVADRKVETAALRPGRRPGQKRVGSGD